MGKTKPAIGEAKSENPEVLGGVVPYLCVQDASAAAEFYKAAFNAVEVARKPADDGERMLHIHLYINGGSLMLSDPFPEHGCGFKDQQGYTLHLQVDDVDAWWSRAVEAGAEIVMPLQLMFWGDRYGQLKDAFGVSWSMAMPGEPDQ